MASFEWDDANSDHIALHSVSAAEVEEAATDPQRVRFSAHSGYIGYIGKTEGGRILVVILQRILSEVASRHSRNVWRPVTARDASTNEKKSYRRRSR